MLWALVQRSRRPAAHPALGMGPSLEKAGLPWQPQLRRSNLLWAGLSPCLQCSGREARLALAAEREAFFLGLEIRFSPSIPEPPGQWDPPKSKARV